MADAMRRFVTVPGTVEVVTFGTGNPAATASGARICYERIGFLPAEAAAPAPKGGSRQVYRLADALTSGTGVPQLLGKVF
jgi:hypothetical protein